MRLSSISYFFVFLSFIFFLGCQKQESVETSASRVQEKIEIKQKDTVEETGALLKELSGKNPFRPDHSFRGTVAGQPQSEALKGIVWDQKRPYAILGGSVVIEGDEINGKKVLRIERNAVVLDDGIRQEVLKLQDLD